MMTTMMALLFSMTTKTTTTTTGLNDREEKGSFLFLLRADAMKFMTSYHNDTIMVARNAKEIHANADEETLVVGDVHADNEEERNEMMV